MKYSQILFNYFEPQDIDSGMVSLLVSSVVDRGGMGSLLVSSVVDRGGMVSLLVSSVVDRELGPQSCQTKDNLIGICCFSVKHITLRSKCRLVCSESG